MELWGENLKMAAHEHGLLKRAVFEAMAQVQVLRGENS
jgi:hypothetical protein